MNRISIILLATLGLSACSGVEVSPTLAGYIPPPPQTTVSEELKLEYDRCVKLGKKVNCAQAAYDIVRKVKGLEPRKVPEGIVIILRGDGGHGGDSETDGDDKKE